MSRIVEGAHLPAGVRLLIGVGFATCCWLACGAPRANHSGDGRPQPATPKQSALEARASTSTGDVRVEVLDTGAVPRAKLRYAAKAGSLRVGTLQLEITNAKDNSTVRESRLAFIAKVEQVGSAGFEITYVCYVDSTGALVETPDRFADEGNRAVGSVVRYSDRGRQLSFTPAADDASLARAREAELRAIGDVSWLPVEAVGLGAKWRIRTPESHPQRIRGEKESVTEVVAIEGTRITLRKTSSSRSRRQNLNGRVYDSMASDGVTTVVLELSDPVSAVPVEQELSQAFTMVQDVNGRLVEHEMRTARTTTRVGEVISSD